MATFGGGRKRRGSGANAFHPRFGSEEQRAFEISTHKKGGSSQVKNPLTVWLRGNAAERVDANIQPVYPVIFHRIVGPFDGQVFAVSSHAGVRRNLVPVQ